jgi:hypothetical protein
MTYFSEKELKVALDKLALGDHLTDTQLYIVIDWSDSILQFQSAYPRKYDLFVNDVKRINQNCTEFAIARNRQARKKENESKGDKELLNEST